MHKITPFFWFDGTLEPVVNFYTSVFPNSKVTFASPQSAQIVLEGQTLMFLNGGPYYKLSPAVSLFVNCETQAEIDELWEKLTADGGEPGRCGWLVDKFGLSWQLVPSILGGLLNSPDPVKSKRAMEAMLAMNKLDIAALKKAYDGET